jgi:hypothetical protein
MRFSTERVGTRREFFRAVGRYSVATALAAFAALAAWRTNGAGRRCVNLGICGNCDQFTRCDLPPARNKRQIQNGG